MKKLAAVLLLAAAVTLGWFALLEPANRDESDPVADTEITVRVATVTRATFRAYVTAFGRVEPQPAGATPAASARVAPAVPGIVVAVLCVDGQRVAKGDLLFQLDSRAADVAVEFAAQNVERQRRLIEFEGTSERALREAEQQLDAARVQQALLRVQSPLAGTVTRVNVRPGEAVDLTTVMAEIIDLERLVVSARVPSGELTGLETGQVVEVKADGSSAPISAALSFISPEVDASTGTALVRAALPVGSGLRPGQFVTLRIVSAEHADRLGVPVQSVVTDAAGETAIAVITDGIAKRQRVQTGLSDGDSIEVEANGLQPGMTVVTEGIYGLPEETKVRVLDD